MCVTNTLDRLYTLLGYYGGHNEVRDGHKAHHDGHK